MSFEEKHIDKLIKSKMDNFEIVPPADVWDNIEAALLKNQAIVRRNKMIGAGATIVLTTLLVVFLTFNDKTEMPQEDQEIQQTDSTIISDTVTSNNFEISTKHSTKNTSNVAASNQQNTNKKENVIQQKSSVKKIESTDKNDIFTTVIVESNIPAMFDTTPVNNAPAEKVVVKKVIKKPVYIVQQDTIYKVDTLSKKKKW